MTLRSIDTRYGGCLFRSRLEARWAVYLDHLGIEWEYEPQGFELKERLTRGPGTIRYLPDFWLPGLGCWGEVKGSLDRDDALRLVDAAAALSSPAGGCGGGNDLVVFGHLARGVVVGSPIRLHMHKGDLQATCWKCPEYSGVTIGCDEGTVVAGIETSLLRGYGCSAHNLHPAHLEALDAARTARFEHGARPKAARTTGSGVRS